MAGNAGFADTKVADAVKNSWVDTKAPQSWRPYLRMMRADRPIGWWLLLLPCWQSLALAGVTTGFRWSDLWLAAAFLIGAVAMRGAGCCLNDIVDHRIDAKVERTRSRPIPSGAVTVTQAAICTGALCLIGLAVLLTMNTTAIAVAFASLIFVVIYPFMKRVTYWPQLFLGFAFNWGALVAWAAHTGSLGWPAFWLYIGGICWTIGYDTIYAHQDREDDIAIGVKSTALRFGTRTCAWLTGFYTAAVVLAGAAMLTAGLPPFALIALTPYALHLAWQLRALDIDDGAQCLRLFRANRDAGLLLVAGILVSGAISL